MTTKLETPSARKPASLLPALLAGLLACTIAGAATYALARQPEPLGVPIPPPPAPIFTLFKDSPSQSSFRERRMHEAWATRMAPQPDGLPPLVYRYRSERFGFSALYPYGAENVQYNNADFLKDGVESQALVKVDQALAAIKVSLPPKESSQAQRLFAHDLLGRLTVDGAQLRSELATAKLPGATFETTAYYRETADGKYVHRLYIAGAGARALVFDFMLDPDDVEQGEKYADKIMHSFDPGVAFGALLEVEGSKPPQKPEPRVLLESPPR